MLTANICHRAFTSSWCLAMANGLWCFPSPLSSRESGFMLKQSLCLSWLSWYGWMRFCRIDVITFPMEPGVENGTQIMEFWLPPVWCRLSMQCYSYFRALLGLTVAAHLGYQAFASPVSMHIAVFYWFTYFCSVKISRNKFSLVFMQLKLRSAKINQICEGRRSVKFLRKLGSPGIFNEAKTSHAVQDVIALHLCNTEQFTSAPLRCWKPWSVHLERIVFFLLVRASLSRKWEPVARA